MTAWKPSTISTNVSRPSMMPLWWKVTYQSASRQLTYPPQRLVELVEVGPGVAVIGSEAGEVDVGEEEHVADLETAVAPGVAG